ncbi:MAG: formylglycine-generating enzyme family protein [Nitrospirae bacterium]|nr:formylglycine-generating enzyme family protein [Nitrospirota bacterium]
MDKKNLSSQPAQIAATPGPEPPKGMVFIRGGCFEMGDTFTQVDSDEKPVHRVCVDDFFMGKYEVTNADFDAFVKDSGYVTAAEKSGSGWGVSRKGSGDWGLMKGISWRHPLWPADEISDKMDHPVVQITWDDAQAYVEWLRGKSGKKYRLPTEAEWEYAARSGGKKYKYSWGEGEPSGNIADESAKKKFPAWTIWEGYDDGYVHTAPVGRSRPNESGLYDITGNVWEWTQDWYGDDYYRYSPKNNPKGPESGHLRVLRGGCWISGPEDLHVATRLAEEPDKKEDIIGFRIALPLK